MNDNKLKKKLVAIKRFERLDRAGLCHSCGSNPKHPKSNYLCIACLEKKRIRKRAKGNHRPYDPNNHNPGKPYYT